MSKDSNPNDDSEDSSLMEQATDLGARFPCTPKPMEWFFEPGEDSEALLFLKTIEARAASLGMRDQAGQVLGVEKWKKPMEWNGYEALGQIFVNSYAMAAASALSMSFPASYVDRPEMMAGPAWRRISAPMQIVSDCDYASVVNVVESGLWAKLGDKFQEYSDYKKWLAKGLSQESNHFSATRQTILIDALSDRNLKAYAKMFSKKPSRLVSAKKGSDSLLNRDKPENEMVGRAVWLLKSELTKRRPHTLAGAFLSSGMVLAYDHPDVLAKYPNGVTDGIYALIPAEKFLGLMGSLGSYKALFEMLEKVLGDAALDNPPWDSVKRVSPVGLRQFLRDSGLQKPASVLYEGPLWTEAAEMGLSIGEISKALGQRRLRYMSASRSVVSHDAAEMELGLGQASGALAQSCVRKAMDGAGQSLVEFGELARIATNAAADAKSAQYEGKNKSPTF